MDDKLDKKLLVLMDSYYPDSRATTYIMQRILENLSKDYAVTVCVLNLMNRCDRDNAPSEHNGINIRYLKPLDYSGFFKKCYHYINSKRVFARYKRKYKTTYGYYALKHYSRQIERIIKEQGIKNVVSIASPTDVHICADMVMEKCRNVKWFPVCFDPHAYNMSYSEKMREAFVAEEKILYEKATAILMLKQAENDYENNTLNRKIVYFDLPIMRGASCPPVVDSDKPAVLTYIGNFYKGIRNPDRMLQLLSKIKIDVVIELIGSFSGWGDELESYISRWESAFGKKLKVLGRKSREEIKDYIARSDIMLNLGNTTHNQCPSKVLDYISIGKPIIHFKQVNDCSSMSYLKKYPLIFVAETYGADDDIVCRLEDFIKTSKGKTVSPNMIESLYEQNTIPYICDIFKANIER